MRNKKNGILAVVLCLMLVSLLAACSKKEEVKEDSKEIESNEQEEKLDETDENLQFATASADGNWFLMGALIADQTNGYFTTDPVTAVPSAGSIGNPSLVTTGEADFGMSYGSFLVMAEKGEGAFEDAPCEGLKAVACLSPTLVHVWGDTEIVGDDLTLEDLIENKTPMVFGAMTAGKGSYFVAQQLFSGMDIDNMESISDWGGSMYYADGSDLTGAWKDRHVNVVMNLLNAPDALVEEALISREGRLIDIGSDLAERLGEEYGFLPYTIPKGTYSSQEKDVNTIGLPLVIFTREDISEQVVYNMCRSIYENIDFLSENNSAFAEVNIKELHMGAGIELHEGAKRFYKEAGIME